MSARLHFIVEGQTEEIYVNRVLKPHFAPLSIWCNARCIMTSRKRGIKHSGGIDSYARVKSDVTRWMDNDKNSDAHFTTMIDLYALPTDFPGFSESRKINDPRQRVVFLESAFRKDIGHPHFYPYIQLHEFEALLLADPKNLDWHFINHEQAILSLISDRKSVV